MGVSPIKTGVWGLAPMKKITRTGRHSTSRRLNILIYFFSPFRSTSVMASGPAWLSADEILLVSGIQVRA